MLCQYRSQVLRPHRKIIVDILGHICNLEMAIAMQRKSIIYTPLHITDLDRPLRLSNLGNLYLRRCERFGGVKDMDSESTIRLQLKAVTSIPRDSKLRSAILPGLGFAYARRFERFRERKDIDFHQRRFEWFGDIKDLVPISLALSQILRS